MNKRIFYEHQLQLIGVLYPELYDLSYNPPDYIVEWLDKIDEENKALALEEEKQLKREIEREKERKQEKRINLMLKVLGSLVIVLYVLILFKLDIRY